MPQSRIRSPSLRRLPDPMTIRRELGAISREAALLRSMLRLAERMQRHFELIQTIHTESKA